MVFLLPKDLKNYLAFLAFNIECTFWWRLFQKCVVHTKLDIYVFIEYVVHTHIVSTSHTEECHGQRRYKYLVLGMDKSYFYKKTTLILPKSLMKHIFKMLQFLIDNIFVMFDERVFQQTVSIPMFPFLLTCSFIRTRQTSYRGFSRKTKRN